MLSVVIPAYNEEKMIETTANTITDILNKENIDFELIFVDDGSKDNTWSEIERISQTNKKVRGVHFSRNFGKDPAVFAGLEYVKGDCCVVMDCDLQHPPIKIVEMYRYWQDGYEVVEGIKEDRGKESGLHKFAANTFYRLMSGATADDMAASSDFKLLDRKVVDALNQLPEKQAFFRALSFWVGFKKATVTYKVQERTVGESKWSTKSLIKYAIRNLGSFSAAPLHIITWLGILMMIVAIVFSVVSLVQKISGQAVAGFTTVIILVLFASSIIMISLGIIGYYIARIFEELKGRPKYIVSKTCGEVRE